MGDPVKASLIAINDLAVARLRSPPLDPNVEHDLKEIVRLSRLAIQELDPDFQFTKLVSGT
jgi:hypothetical protein